MRVVQIFSFTTNLADAIPRWVGGHAGAEDLRIPIVLYILAKVQQPGRPQATSDERFEQPDLLKLVLANDSNGRTSRSILWRLFQRVAPPEA